MVWGCFSRDGVGPLIRITGIIMDRVMYMQIPEQNMVAHTSRKMQPGWLFLLLLLLLLHLFRQGPYRASAIHFIGSQIHLYTSNTQKHINNTIHKVSSRYRWYQGIITVSLVSRYYQGIAGIKVSRYHKVSRYRWPILISPLSSLPFAGRLSSSGPLHTDPRYPCCRRQYYVVICWNTSSSTSLTPWN